MPSANKIIEIAIVCCLKFLGTKSKPFIEYRASAVFVRKSAANNLERLKVYCQICEKKLLWTCQYLQSIR